MILIDKVLDEGNCVRVTDRGKEACECADKSTTKIRRRPHSRQSRKVTDRNLIQGRCAQVSEPTFSETVSFARLGKSRACAVKVNRLIQGELESRSGSRLDAESRSRFARAARRFQQSAEAIVRTRYTPVAIGRAEP